MLRSAGCKRPSRRCAPTEFVAGVQAPLAPGRHAGDDPAQRPLRRAAPPDQAPDHGGAHRPRSRGAVPDAVSGISGAQDPRRAARAWTLVTPRRPSLAPPAFPGSALPLPAPDFGLFPLAASIVWTRTAVCWLPNVFNQRPISARVCARPDLPRMRPARGSRRPSTLAVSLRASRYGRTWPGLRGRDSAVRVDGPKRRERMPTIFKDRSGTRLQKENLRSDSPRCPDQTRSRTPRPFRLL